MPRLPQERGQIVGLENIIGTGGKEIVQGNPHRNPSPGQVGPPRGFMPSAVTIHPGGDHRPGLSAPLIPAQRAQVAQPFKTVNVGNPYWRCASRFKIPAFRRESLPVQAENILTQKPPVPCIARPWIRRDYRQFLRDMSA